MTLTRREQKRRQMVRVGYAGVGVGVLLVLIAVSGGSILIGLVGALILVVSGWAARALRSL